MVGCSEGLMFSGGKKIEPQAAFNGEDESRKRLSVVVSTALTK